VVELYPTPVPYARGMLDGGDGNQLYREEAGNPEGTPALLVHRRFDTARYRLIRFDQRGCGRSTPHASDPGTDLGANTDRKSTRLNSSHP